MDNHAENGNISLITGVILGIVSWFSPENIDTTIKIFTGLGATLGFIFGVRYHWYATKVKKEELKRLKSGKTESEHS